MNQLPTLKNLKLWGCSNCDLCSKCGRCQSNKHVLSHCSSPEALARYFDRHNKILKLIGNWIKPKMNSTANVYYDLTIPGTRHISDLFNGVRPDLAIVNSSRIDICELTVCHETNLESSRKYKLNKYSNISSRRSCLVENHTVNVYTIEISVLGFVIVDPNFLQQRGLASFSNALLTEITKTAVLASHDI